MDHYAEVIEVARHTAKFAMPYESNLPIFVCRGPIRPPLHLAAGEALYLIETS